MKLLHLAAGNLFGGIEQVLVTIAHSQHLVPELQHQFALCCQGQLAVMLQEAKAPVHQIGPLRARRPWTVWRARRELAAVLQDERHDAVVCHGCWPYALLASTAKGHCPTLAFWAHDLADWRQWTQHLARRTRPDVVVANSNFTARSIAQVFDPDLIHVLYYPVAVPGVRDRPVVRKRIRLMLGTPTEHVVIIQTCRLEQWKGHFTLLRALAQLYSLPHWTCWFVGGPQRPHEQRYLRQLRHAACRFGIDGRVRFLGQRRDVPALLAAADIHCQPNSVGEPFGVAFIEAMYAGLPVVTTSVGAAREIVNQHCGLLVPPSDPTALADALRQLIVDRPLRQSLGQAGPHRAKQLCDPATQLQALRRLLEPLSHHDSQAA